jgi:hypothetical protein
MANQPFLRRVFDRAERAIGKPLEDAAESSQLTDAYLARKSIERTLRSALDRPTGAFLHFINIPARSDVRRVNRQIAALTEEVRRLSTRLEELQAGPAAQGSTSPRPKRKPAARKPAAPKGDQ